MWHCDGYDKLKPFGLPIHGCIDGYVCFIDVSFKLYNWADTQEKFYGLKCVNLITIQSLLHIIF